MRRFTRTFAAMLAVASAGACRDESLCLRHSDCAGDEHCQRGTCVIDSTPDRADGDAGEGGEHAATAGSTSAGTSSAGRGGGATTGGSGATGGRSGATGGATAGDAGASGAAGASGDGGSGAS